MAICTIIAILLVVLFVGAVIWKTKKVPESISAIVYDLPDGALKWTWSIWLWAVSLFSFIPVIDILDRQGLGFLAFATLVLLVFTGAWPLFDTEHRKYHYAFAIIAGVMSQVCVWYVCPWWLLLWLLFVILFIWKTADVDGKWETWTHRVLIAEMICYFTIICSVLIR